MRAMIWSPTVKVGVEAEEEDGVETIVPQTSLAGIGDGRDRVSDQVSASAVMAEAWTRMRYWVEEGVGTGVEVVRERIEGGFKWRARMMWQIDINGLKPRLEVEALKTKTF